MVILDQHISNKALDRLELNGYDVWKVTDTAIDHEWFKEGLKRGVKIVVSRDKEIERYCYITDVTLVSPPENLAGNEQARYIHNKIKEITK